MKTPLFLLVAFAATLFVACDDDDAGGGARTGEPVTPNVQARAIAAFDALQSTRVHAEGVVDQDDQRVEFSNEYIEVDDRLSYTANSTFNETASTIELISVPPDTWTREAGEWVPFPATGAALDVFTGRRLWRLVPFDNATLVGEEELEGRSVRHYETATTLSLGLAEFAGTLIATGDVELSGEVGEVDIDYWVDATTGVPVQATYRTDALDLTVTLDAADDASLRVDAPAGAATAAP